MGGSNGGLKATRFRTRWPIISKVIFSCEPLRDWDVSRPAPYFGFEIPDSPGNYWYVWFDAPIGYIGSTRQWCKRQGEDFDAWWRSPETEVHHFIGKDITYFHTLFWPAMLHVAQFNLPKKVHIHGFLTVNGEKMSKSKGTFICASTYLEHLDPSYLRYYYASKLSSGVDDIDLNFEDFIGKVNSDLVGKVVNIASRTARFVEEIGLSETYPNDNGLFARAAADGQAIAEAYENCDYSKAMRNIMAAADHANKYVEAVKPWELRRLADKDPTMEPRLQNVCTIAMNLFRQLAVYLAPVLPRLGRTNRRIARRSDRVMGTVATAANRRRVGKFTAHDAACGSKEGGGHDRRQCRAGRGGITRGHRSLRHRWAAEGRAAGRNRSASTSSPRSTSASPACWRPKTWPGPRSC